MSKPKQLLIDISTESGVHYDILVAGGTPRERAFTTDDGIIGLKGRLTAIADQIGTFFEPDDAPPEAGAGQKSSPDADVVAQDPDKPAPDVSIKRAA